MSDKPREFWIELHDPIMGRQHTVWTENPAKYIDNPDLNIHVIEYSALLKLDARIQKLREAAERLGKAVSMGNREQVICASIELREALQQDDDVSKT